MTKLQFRSALEQLALTQEQAAGVLHKTPRMISNYANGHWEIPLDTADLLRLYCKYPHEMPKGARQ